MLATIFFPSKRDVTFSTNCKQEYHISSFVGFLICQTVLHHLSEIGITNRVSSNWKLQMNICRNEFCPACCECREALYSIPHIDPAWNTYVWLARWENDNDKWTRMNISYTKWLYSRINTNKSDSYKIKRFIQIAAISSIYMASLT